MNLPSDLEGSGNDLDMDEDDSENDGGAFDPDPRGPFTIDEDEFDEKPTKKQNKEAEEEVDYNEAEDELNEVFAAARENQEMDLLENMRGDKRKHLETGEGFVNEELFKKMDTIETEMINPKSWQLLGEARARERPANSLLDCHLDFNTATKVAPTITKETTSAIETLIKQRVLDELFDDPILRQTNGKKRKHDGDAN